MYVNLGYQKLLISSAEEITPITNLDNKPINNGERGEVTCKLQNKFQEIISGKNSLYENWLTYTR